MRVTVQHVDNISAHYTKEPTTYETACQFDVDEIDFRDKEAPYKLLEDIFDWLNRGSMRERWDLLGNGRSLSVGDIVEFAECRFYCAPIGWEVL